MAFITAVVRLELNHFLKGQFDIILMTNLRVIAVPTLDNWIISLLIINK